MKYEATRYESPGANRRIIAAALITFSITFLLTFLIVGNSSDLNSPEKSPTSEGKTIEDVFCHVGVDAPMPYLRCGDPAHQFEELRRKIITDAGFDFLATCGDMKRHEKAKSSKPGVAYNSRHKSGQAFDYNQRDSRLLLVRENIADLTYWRTYLRCEKQDGTCGVRADLDTDNAGRVSAFVFDFTAAAEGLGWWRIPAQKGWEYRQTKKEFWHYEIAEDVDIPTKFMVLLAHHLSYHVFSTLSDTKLN